MICLFDLLKRERPSCCHRVGIVGRLESALSEQYFAMSLVEVKIVLKATLSFFKIGFRLIKGERKMIECDDDISCLIDLFIGSLLKALCSTKEKMCPFKPAHRFYFQRGSQRTDRIGTCGKQNTPVPSLGKTVAH